MEIAENLPGQACGRPTPYPTVPRAQRAALIGLVAGGAVVVLDFFIVLSCLHSIELSLGATKAQLQLVLAAYAVANGSFLVLGGRLGDVFGRKRVFIWSVGAFALTSAMCGVAGSTTMLIVFRILQGVAGAMLQPQVLGLLAVNFESSVRPRVFGLYAAAMGMAGIAAQMIGGSMVQLLPLNIGWRACFLVSVPLCVLVANLAGSVKEGNRAKSMAIDFPGALLLAVALGCACAFLTIGREQAWPAAAWLVFAVGGVAALLFASWMVAGRARGAERIIPAGLLAANGFRSALLTILFFYCGVASLYFVLALELRSAAGLSPIQIGLLFAWLGLCFAVSSSSKKLKSVVGNRWSTAGMTVLLCGHLAMAIAASKILGAATTAGFVVSCGLQGTGIGLLMAPLISASVSRISHDLLSAGGGLVAATQQMGNSLGVCAIGFAYFGSASVDAKALAHFPGSSTAVVYLVAMLGVLWLLLRAEPSKDR